MGRKWQLAVWLGRSALAAMVVGAVAFALPAAPVAADVAVFVGPHGTHAAFAVQADQAKKYILSASTAAIIGNAFNPSFSGDMVSAATFGMKQEAGTWVVNLYGLQPNTTYNYILKVTDPDQTRGLPYFYKTGAFKTKQRQVTVQFKDIEIIDDSDDLSQGDLTFLFKINGTHEFALNYSVDASTGETVHPNKAKVIANAGTTLKLAVQGHDDDCFSLTLCTTGTGFHNDDAGETSDQDWATANGPYYTTDFDDADADYDKLRSFTISTTAAKLKFKVHGTYTVKYV